MDLYKADKQAMINEGVLDKAYLALSREPSIPKVSVANFIVYEIVGSPAISDCPSREINLVQDERRCIVFFFFRSPEESTVPVSPRVYYCNWSSDAVAP